MAIYDLFSKRRRRERGEIPDVYQVEIMSEKLRYQVSHILNNLIEEIPENVSDNLMHQVYRILIGEFGVPELVKMPARARFSPYDQIYNFILTHKNVEEVIDAIELLLHIYANEMYIPQLKSAGFVDPVGLISEINTRMREDGFGLQFENDQFISVESDYVHQEAVRPALSVLREKEFQGANDEFLAAHEHFRHGRKSDCMVQALKSLESVLKVICDKKKWDYDKERDTAKKLIDLCRDQGLFNNYLDSHIGTLVSGLKSGAPTIRNREAGHGQGAEVKDIPEYYVHYHLNLTATCIVMLVSAYKDIREGGRNAN